MILAGAVRHCVLPEVNDLIELTSFPAFVTAMGKSGVNEEFLSYGGVYAGAGTVPQVKEAGEGSDAVLWIGNYPVRLLLLSTLISCALTFHF